MELICYQEYIGVSVLIIIDLLGNYVRTFFIIFDMLHVKKI